MSRITGCFKNLNQQRRTALIPYVTAGDPNPAVTVPLMHAMVAAGADIIELGIPFSDPMADGPVIQLACERALEHNVSLGNVLSMVAEFRKDNDSTPVVLMGYLNPIEAMGRPRFIERALQAGVDGVLIVDLPPEELDDFGEQLRQADLDAVFLLAPTTTPQRIASICAASTGYVYYVSLKGVTGSAALNVESVADKVAEIRKATQLPVGVGFGIKDATAAAAVAGVADGVIVGSALVNKIADLKDNPERIAEAVADVLRGMRKAMDEQAGVAN